MLLFRCGAVTNVAPFFRELRKGSPSEEAWRRTRNVILAKRMRYGHWERNRLVRDAKDDDELCSVSDVRYSSVLPVSLTFLIPSLSVFRKPRAKVYAQPLQTVVRSELKDLQGHSARNGECRNKSTYVPVQARWRCKPYLPSRKAWGAGSCISGPLALPSWHKIPRPR